MAEANGGPVDGNSVVACSAGHDRDSQCMSSIPETESVRAQQPNQEFPKPKGSSLTQEHPATPVTWNLGPSLVEPTNPRQLSHNFRAWELTSHPHEPRCSRRTCFGVRGIFPYLVPTRPGSVPSGQQKPVARTIVSTCYKILTHLWRPGSDLDTFFCSLAVQGGPACHTETNHSLRC